MNCKIMNMKKNIIISTAGLMLALAGCQPLYTSTDGSVGQLGSQQGSALSSILISPVSTRTAQQVRNHLIFLLSGGSSPTNPAFKLKIRVSSTSSTTASRLDATGKTAGKVLTSVSYELYDNSKNKITHRGTRTASASYDQTSQSFSNERAKLDAENRSAKSAAEQIRLAIAADLKSN